MGSLYTFSYSRLPTVSKLLNHNVIAKCIPGTPGPVPHKHKDLERVMTDAEIEASLGDRHQFSETILCHLLARLITAQPSGEEGELLSNGFANLFYTSSCVVSVRWGADYREWDVYTWRRDDDRWRAGNRVFSPATE